MIEHESGQTAGMPGSLLPIRTLVIDDNRFDRKRLMRLGEHTDLPLIFEEATSVQGLRRCLDKQHYDLFLIDYAMPEGDGIEALDAIRAHEGHKDSAAIMISGAADSRVAISAMKHGCRDFLTKDEISSPVLQRAVVEALNNSRDFTRHFDRARPVADVEALRGLMKLALDDATVREILKAPLEEGLLAAARTVGLSWAEAEELKRWPIDFSLPDDFIFR